MSNIKFGMNNEIGLNGTQKLLMPLFIIADTSSSMAGDKIEQVKSAVEEIREKLKSFNATNDDADVTISLLTFDDKTQWKAKNEDPAVIDPDFKLGTLTYMGQAFSELEENLSRSKMLETSEKCGGFKRAVLILLTDGLSNDNIDAGIEKLMQNNWFVTATRIGFAVGEGADRKCLERFTGSDKTVLTVNNIDLLSTILSKVTVVASMTATHAPGLDDENASKIRMNAKFFEYAKATESIIQDALTQIQIEDPECDLEAAGVLCDGDDQTFDNFSWDII